MTVDYAIDRLQAIQADLDAGRLTMPYPEPIRRELMELADVFMAHCQTSEQARALMARIQTPETLSLPW
jgi:hypothetical protein